jgi:cytochrome c oxidase subunit II
MQTAVWILTVAATAGLGAIFLWVAANASHAQGDAKSMASTAYRWRGRIFWLSIVAGAVITFATLTEWPISGHAVAAGKPDTVIRAVGQQWRWTLDRDSVRVGELVEFQVTADDVNHGFAIYQGKSRIIAQAQAMPGYVNKLQVRFAEPGEYEVLCLEYCGLAHHGMRATIKVR